MTYLIETWNGIISSLSSRWDTSTWYGATNEANLGFWELLRRYLGLAISSTYAWLWESPTTNANKPGKRSIPYVIKDIFLYIWETFAPDFLTTYSNPLMDDVWELHR